LKAQIKIPIPRVKKANRANAGKISKDSNPILASNKTIKIPNGIKEKTRFIKEVKTSAIGNAMVSTLIDFKIPLLSMTDNMVVLEALLKKFQKISPVSAYSG
jgi:hypothetical protein